MKTPIEKLEEEIEKETDPGKLATLMKRLERLLQEQADEPTGNEEEDNLWGSRNKKP